MTLPAGWGRSELGQLADLRIGRTPPRACPTFWAEGNGTPWVAIADMPTFGTVTATREAVSNLAGEAIFRDAPVPAGTLLMSFKLTIGRTAVLATAAYHNEAIVSIYPRGAAQRDFLKYYLPTIDFANHQDRAVKGNTLNLAKLARLPVPVPPLPEQRRIAAFLTKLQRRAQLERDRARTLAALKSATLAKLFREGLHGEPLKNSPIGPIPQSWRVAPLGDALAEVRYGLSERGKPTGACPILRMNCQISGAVVFRDLQFIDPSHETLDRYRLADGDVLFNRTNSLDLVGRTAMFRGDRPAVFASYMLRLRTKPEILQPAYLNAYLNLDSTQRRVKALATKGVSQANINATKLKTFLTPLATKDEQKAIGTHAEQLSTRATQHKTTAASLSANFRAALERLMTGELRLPADAPETAEAAHA